MVSAGIESLCFPLWGQVCGYRLRLHFDGYSECHDFWINANSPDIHPAGWFEKTGHKLQPPKVRPVGWSQWGSELRPSLSLPCGFPLPCSRVTTSLSVPSCYGSASELLLCPLKRSPPRLRHCFGRGSLGRFLRVVGSSRPA